MSKGKETIILILNTSPPKSSNFIIKLKVDILQKTKAKYRGKFFFSPLNKASKRKHIHG